MLPDAMFLISDLILRNVSLRLHFVLAKKSAIWASSDCSRSVCFSPPVNTPNRSANKPAAKNQIRKKRLAAPNTEWIMGDYPFDRNLRLIG